MIPESKEVTYECENGHVNTKHNSQPRSADLGFMPVCIDCSARLTRKIVPLFECEDCGNVWPYSGDADRPTCSDCRGKKTRPVSEMADDLDNE